MIFTARKNHVIMFQTFHVTKTQNNYLQLTFEMEH